MTRTAICVFVTNDLSFDQRMQRICSALVEFGYDVTLVGRTRKNSIPFSPEVYRTHRFSCWFNQGILFYLEINLRILFFAMRYSFDLFYAVDLDTISGVALASGLQRKKFIFDAHEWFAEVPELLNKPMKRKIWNGINYLFVPKASLRYTVNESLAKVFSEEMQVPFYVLRNVPTGHSEPEAHTPAKKIILYQGVLNAGRGLESAIEAMPLLADFELHLAGEGDLSDELRILAQESPAKDRILFLGYQSPQALKEITRRATIGLNLLESESKNYYYSLANKFFDYMHAEIPSVNMDFPEYRNIINEYPCAVMIKSCDAQLIADAVNSTCDDNEAYARYCQSAAEAKMIFNWEHEKKKLRSWLEKL